MAARLCFQISDMKQPSKIQPVAVQIGRDHHLVGGAGGKANDVTLAG
jgi:hypothetical protein